MHGIDDGSGSVCVRGASGNNNGEFHKWNCVLHRRFAEFTITTTIGKDAEGKTVLSTSEFADRDAISAMEYYDETEMTWKNLLHDGDGNFGPADGIKIAEGAVGQTIENKFRVIFSKPGEYSFTAALVEKGQSESIASTSASFTVELNPITQAVNWKDKFEASLGDDNGAAGMTWDTLITAVYYYQEAEKYVNTLNEGDVKDAENNRLTELTAYYNSVSALDMSGKSESKYTVSTGALTLFTGLTDLNLNGTGISDTGGLAGLTKLEILNLGGNKEINNENFGALSDMSVLKNLDLSGTGITDIGGLIGEDGSGVADTLELLDISDTGVTKLESVWDAAEKQSAFPELRILKAENLKLESISGLVEITSAADFDAEGLT